jgi:hypothetical protein
MIIIEIRFIKINMGVEEMISIQGVGEKRYHQVDTMDKECLLIKNHIKDMISRHIIKIM